MRLLGRLETVNDDLRVSFTACADSARTELASNSGEEIPCCSSHDAAGDFASGPPLG